MARIATFGRFRAMRAAVVPLDVKATIADAWIASARSAATAATACGAVPPTSWNSHHTNPMGGLANYYRNEVIGGPGAFVMVAENFNSFGDVLVKKLVTEIARAEPRQWSGGERN